MKPTPPALLVALLAALLAAPALSLPDETALQPADSPDRSWSTGSTASRDIFDPDTGKKVATVHYELHAVDSEDDWTSAKVVD